MPYLQAIFQLTASNPDHTNNSLKHGCRVNLPTGEINEITRPLYFLPERKQIIFY